MTSDEVTIYVGSIVNPNYSFHLTFGRLEFHCKYNPLLWYKDCCLYSEDYLSIDKRIWVVAGGPIASIFCYDQCSKKEFVLV
jgi:hypothetical protein